LNIKNLLPAVAFAADEEINISPKGSFEGLGALTIPNIVSGAIQLILVLAALIAFIFLIVGGVKWITAGGDKEKTAGAQKTLTSALVGLVIVFAAWAIMSLIGKFFGVDIFKLTIPTVGQ
jgi:predicted small integral membrane protein